MHGVGGYVARETHQMLHMTKWAWGTGEGKEAPDAGLTYRGPLAITATVAALLRGHAGAGAGGGGGGGGAVATGLDVGSADLVRVVDYAELPDHQALHVRYGEEMTNFGDLAKFKPHVVDNIRRLFDLEDIVRPGAAAAAIAGGAGGAAGAGAQQFAAAAAAAAPAAAAGDNVIDLTEVCRFPPLRSSRKATPASRKCASLINRHAVHTPRQTPPTPPLRACSLAG